MPDVKFSNLYPYTDFHELNLDWVIKEVKFWSERVGKSIQKIELTGTVGLVDTYTITYSDGTTSTFDVTNGNGIASVAKTGTAGLVDTYTITFQDGSTTTFEVHNGTASIDPTLTMSDYAADAKATGDRFETIENNISDKNDIYLWTNGYLNTSGNVAAQSSSEEKVTEFIPIYNGMSFTVKMEKTGSQQFWFAYCIYDTSYNLLGSRYTETSMSSTYERTITISNSSVSFIRFSYRSYGGDVTIEIARSPKNDVFILGNLFDPMYNPRYNASYMELRRGSCESVSANDVVSYSQPTYRVFTPKVQTITTPLTFIANSGFRFYLFVKAPGAPSYSGSGWQTFYQMNVIGTKYAFTIARSSDNTSEIADIKTFGEQIGFDNPIKTVISDWENLEKSRIEQVAISGRTLSRVRSIAHRGLDYIAPENTMPAFQMAAKAGFPCIEVDVAMTSDNVAVLLHDSTINRTARNSDGTAIGTTINIYDITYTQALTYDFGIFMGSQYAGTKIPTLKEFLTFCRNTGIHPYIELKYNANWNQTTLLTAVTNAIKETGMLGHVSIISFIHGYLNDLVPNYLPNERIGVLTGALSSGEITYAAGLKTATNEIFMDSSSAGSSEIAAAIANDIPVELYTLNDEAGIIGADPYISGITSDLLVAGIVLYNHSAGV